MKKKMVEMKTACIILDSVVCQARFSPCRILCPKQMYPYWREIWLERVEDKREAKPADAAVTEEKELQVLSASQR